MVGMTPTERRLALFFLLLCPCLGEDTVAEDLGVHQLGRLVELLTPRECKDLLSALSHPEDRVFQKLQQLSPESNDLSFSPRLRRDTDKEKQCQTALTEWLVNHGEQMYYDRLPRALQLIGRTDIAMEVGKNINQDKALSLQKYVEDYHKWVEVMGSSLDQREIETHQLASKQAVRQARDLTWSDLELVVEREQQPPYSRQFLDGVRPLIYGILLGFAGAFLVGLVVFIFALRMSQGDGATMLRVQTRIKGQRQRHHSPNNMSFDVTSSESDSVSCNKAMATLQPQRVSREASGFSHGNRFFREFWVLVRRKPGLA